MKILSLRLSPHNSHCCNLFTSSPCVYFPSFFLNFLSPGCIFPPLSGMTIGKLSEAELSVIWCLLLLVLLFFFSNQHIWFGGIQEDSGLENRNGEGGEVWGGAAGGSCTVRDKTRQHPAVSQDVQAVELLVFPTRLSTISAARHTNKLKNSTPRANFQSSSESNKGQPSSWRPLGPEAQLEVNITNFCKEDHGVNSLMNQFLFNRTAEKLLVPIRSALSLLFSPLLLSSDQSNMSGNEDSLSCHAKLIGCCDRPSLRVKQLPHLGFPN